MSKSHDHIIIHHTCRSILTNRRILTPVHQRWVEKLAKLHTQRDTGDDAVLCELSRPPIINTFDITNNDSETLTIERFVAFYVIVFDQSCIHEIAGRTIVYRNCRPTTIEMGIPMTELRSQQLGVPYNLCTRRRWQKSSTKVKQVHLRYVS